MRVARLVVLSADQQHFLQSVARARRASAGPVERAQIVLLAGAGLQGCGRCCAQSASPVGAEVKLPLAWLCGLGDLTGGVSRAHMGCGPTPEPPTFPARGLVPTGF
jgi:hypothetical protein